MGPNPSAKYCDPKSTILRYAGKRYKIANNSQVRKGM